jgi:hypothetical protein
MSYTKDIDFIQNCRYMNPETQNANVMLNDCINDTTEDIKYVKPVIKHYNIDNSPIAKECKGKEEKGIEGFTNKPFITDNGPGESYFKVNECPKGFSYCNKTKMCKQFCRNCSTGIKNKRLIDPCIYGNYNGIDNQGNVYCSRNFDDLEIKTININPFIF